MMNKSNVEIKKNTLYIRGKEVPFISGEMHYWRLNPSCWKDCLNQIREMGLQIVSTYVPWDYHEYKRGKFDFTGKTDATRNLQGFLKLLKDEGFYVIIRPGPYIYSEWPNDGVPDYAHEYHRLHPIFLRYAKHYLKEVCEVIRPFLVSRKGGHVFLLQADNELDPWPDVYGQQYGLIGEPGMFQAFLKKKYHDKLKDLNEAWGADFERFDEAGPFFENRLEGEKELRRVLDYYEFKHAYTSEVAHTIVGFYREFGIDIPIYLNLYSFFYAHDWNQLQDSCDLTGIDLYPENEFHADSSDHRKMLDKIRLLKTVSPLPFSAEFASGVWHDRYYVSGTMTPNHYRLLCMSALLAGLKGWNWYMLVNRDNWYASPINEWGRRRHELYNVFQEMVSVFKQLNPSKLDKLTDVSVTYNTMQHAVRTAPKESAILHSLYDGDFDYEIFDTRKNEVAKKVLFYSGNQWLDQKSQENLLAYVKKGGNLILFRNFPRKDDHFELLNTLGLHDPFGVLFEFQRKVSLKLGKFEPVLVTSSVCTFQSPPGTPIYADVDGVGRQLVGYIMKQGKGTIFHLGIEPNSQLIELILKYYNLEEPCRSLTKGVQSAIFKRGSKHFVIAVNNGDEEKTVAIRLKVSLFKKKKIIVRDLVTHEKVQTLHSPDYLLSTNIPRKDGRVFELV